jgi:membrane-bound lytic murein transglycosylase B
MTSKPLSRLGVVCILVAPLLWVLGMTLTPVGDRAVAGHSGEPLERALDVIRKHGVVDTAFARMLAGLPTTTFDSGLVKINVTNFARKTDYTHNHNAYSVKQAKAFVKEHDAVLRAAERQYKVAREAIAAILWVETKNGRYTGKNHLPSVYLSVVLSAEESFVERNVDNVMASLAADSTKRDSIRGVVQAKANKKVRWAMEQLQAMHIMHRDGRVDVTTLRGSWAGAFGLSQFLPASYTRWARDGNGDGRVDLFDVNDAIHSVANYLKENGWGPTVKERRAAVFHYNNSDPYVDAVLTLAEKLK